MAAPAIQRPSAKWIVLGSWQGMVSYRQSTGLKRAELQCCDTGIRVQRSVFSSWMVWQKGGFHTLPLFGGSGAVGTAACAFHTSGSSLLWAKPGKSWLGRGGRLTVVSISSAMTTSSKAIMEQRVFLGIHLSLFNWLPFIEFAIWFIFPLTAQPQTALALKAYHCLYLKPHFKWMILLLRGIRKMLDQLLENRECQLCVLFLFECLDFKIYYRFTIYSTILIPKLPKRLSSSDSGDSSCVL